jgi:hypothetical protein
MVGRIFVFATKPCRRNADMADGLSLGRAAALPLDRMQGPAAVEGSGSCRRRNQGKDGGARKSELAPLPCGTMGEPAVQVIFRTCDSASQRPDQSRSWPRGARVSSMTKQELWRGYLLPWSTLLCPAQRPQQPQRDHGDAATAEPMK